MVTCVVGLVFAILWADAEKSKRIDEARAVAEEVGNWFSDELDKALFALYTLRQFVVQTPGMPMIVGLIWLCIRSLLTLMRLPQGCILMYITLPLPQLCYSDLKPGLGFRV